MSGTRSGRVVVVDGSRTPFLRSNTDFKDLNSYELARLALLGLRKKTLVDVDTVDRVIMGTVISNLTTSNVAREAMLGAGFNRKTPANTVTLACISANMAIANGVDLIALGRAKTVVAGGTESMSDIPIRYRKPMRRRLVESQRAKGPGDYLKLAKGLKLKDLLPEIPSISEFSTGLTMGQDCDRMAARFGVSREAQDAFALRSHLNAHQATEDGILGQEIEPVRLSPKFQEVARDNGVRGDSSAEKMAKLRPAFEKPYGTVTAANASYLTDGAAAVLLMDEEAALEAGYKPKARIVDYVFTAMDPEEELLLGPTYAMAELLTKNKMGLDDVGVFEIHEAFAGQVLANLKCLADDDFARERLGLEKALGEIPMDSLNVHGGSLSLGHPFGATGARLVTTASNRLQREGARYAMVAACAAGAQGHAMILERYEQG